MKRLNPLDLLFIVLPGLALVYMLWLLSKSQYAILWR